MSDLCPICEAGHLMALEEPETINGWTDNYQYSICDACNAEVITNAQARTNEARFLRRERVGNRQ